MKLITTITNNGGDKGKPYVTETRLNGKLLDRSCFHSLIKARDFVDKCFPGTEIIEEIDDKAEMKKAALKFYESIE